MTATCPCGQPAQMLQQWWDAYAAMVHAEAAHQVARKREQEALNAYRAALVALEPLPAARDEVMA